MRPEHWLFTIPLRLRSLFRWAQTDQELDDELREHLERKTEEYVAQGMTQEEAHRRARLDLGGIEQTKEKCRDARRVNWIQDFVQDLRFGLRLLRKSPGFTAVAVLTLALGIGTTTAMFSIVDKVVLRPLSYADSGQLVMIDEWTPSFGPIPVNSLHFQEWRRTATSFDQIALVGGGDVNVTDSSEPERLPGARVSPALFPILAVQPQLGRAFLSEEDVPGRDHVVLIGNELWRGRYSADPHILDRTISIDGVAHEIVGVLPANFHFPKLGALYPVTILQEKPQIWKPIALRPEELTPELAVRSAIGASRWRLTRQMIVESLTLSAMGGACGVFVAYLGVRLFLAVAPFDLPRLDEVHVDMSVVMFALLVSTIAGLVIGIWPASQLSAAEIAEVMPSGTRSTSGRGVGRLRSAVVSGQVALGALCLIASGLLLESLVNLLNVDRGFDASQVVTVGVNPPVSQYPTLEKRVAFVRTVLDELKVLPGVTSVAAANMLPLSGEGGNSALSVAGTSTALFEHALGNIRTVSSDYFRTMGMSLQAGRLFNDGDQQRQVAVISTSIAKRAWPGENPIGKRFHFGPPSVPDKEVIGVVNDVRSVSLEAGPSFNVYISYWQGPFIAIEFALKTTNDPAAIAPAIRSKIRGIDAELPVSSLRTMDQIVEGSVAQRRFQTYLVLTFGAAALLLACLGVYGVMSFVVTQRTTEIGIRLAFGAEPGAVLRMVLRQAMRPVVVGVAVAIPLAFLAGSWLRSMVFGVSPEDPRTITVACFSLVIAAALAAYLPARRAMRVDPMVALRYE
ncbi:MAG: hypothetical protein DMG54_32580 [Acidobacteria bacterium]|nr:MAG: hypothetical protein DMG54_32580 [Acidobacteriota bacterium]